MLYNWQAQVKVPSLGPKSNRKGKWNLDSGGSLKSYGPPTPQLVTYNVSMKEVSNNKTKWVKVTQYDLFYLLSTKNRWTARTRTRMSPTCSRRTLSNKFLRDFVIVSGPLNQSPNSWACPCQLESGSLWHWYFSRVTLLMVVHNFSALSILLFFTLVTALITKPGQVSLNTELSAHWAAAGPGLGSGADPQLPGDWRAEHCCVWSLD